MRSNHSPQYCYEQYISKIFHHIIVVKESSRFSAGLLKVDISSFMGYTKNWHMQKQY